MRRRGLGSSKSEHSQQAAAIKNRIERYANDVTRDAKAGTAAQIAYANMHYETGALDAHLKSGGRGWHPATVVTEASHEFTMRCVVPTVKGLDGARRRRRK